MSKTIPDRVLPCTNCNTPFNKAHWYPETTENGNLRWQSKCADCVDAAVAAWREKNRERVNQWARENRFKKKKQRFDKLKGVIT